MLSILLEFVHKGPYCFNIKLQRKSFSLQIKLLFVNRSNQDNVQFGKTCEVKRIWIIQGNVAKSIMPSDEKIVSP